jgi:5-methyltetrahydrofolate--homocysteine methyltransferase
MSDITIDKLIQERIVFFDGASGTLLQSAGLPVGMPPDEWNIERAETIRDIHRQYIEAGSDVISTVTFRAGTFDDGGAERIIAAAVNNCKEAIAECARPVFAALDIGPSGKLLGMTGGFGFNDAYNYFKTQVIAGADAGADVILFETFTDVYELKAAVLAAKENCSLPILATVTFEEGGRTLMGSDAQTAALIFRDMGLSAFGANCSLGPKEMLPVIEGIAKYAKAPVMAQPNAGLPRMEDGVAVYDILPSEFAEAVRDIVGAGARVVGGCCGTSPEYIETLTGTVSESDSPHAPIIPEKIYPTICAPAVSIIVEPGSGYSIETLRIDDASDIKHITSAVKKLSKEYDVIALYIVGDAISQAAEIVSAVSGNARIPLAIGCENAAALDEAVRVCRGKPAVISCAETAKKYGTAVIIDKGAEVPDISKDRIIIADEGRLTS